MLVINDTHIGVTRSGGTTPQSQQALRDYLRDSLANLLDQHQGEHVVINGDFFESFQVDTSEMIKAYEILVKHMLTGPLTMIMGNHDASEKAGRVSSWHTLCYFLKEATNDFRMIDHTDGFCHVTGKAYAISHCMNQSLFDLEIEKAAAKDGTGSYLLLHCNVKNGFSENSDHSLNLNDEQLGNLMRAGWHIVVGHEHQGYELRSGRVLVVGNQFASSVADCIGDEVKNALVVDDKGHRYVQTWSSRDHYIEKDWTELCTLMPDEFKFIRVTGEAKAEQAADVIKVVSALRQNHDAFVVSSAVRVEGADAFSDMAEIGAEGVKAFDVLGAIYSELNEEEVECVKGLLNAQ